MSSSTLISKTNKEISTLINEINDKKRVLYTSNQQNARDTINQIKKILSNIDDKVICFLLIFALF